MRPVLHQQFPGDQALLDSTVPCNLDAWDGYEFDIDADSDS
jgi:hypothetical protein